MELVALLERMLLWHGDSNNHGLKTLEADPLVGGAHVARVKFKSCLTLCLIIVTKPQSSQLG